MAASTIKDIARETGLSIATISKYINGGTLREKNRDAIAQAIQKLGYQVNEYARGLKSNKSRTIGVVIPELSNLFITQIITTIEEQLRGKGYSLIICDCHTSEDIECEVVRFLMGKMVDGIINMPVCKDGRHLKPVVEKGIPIVLIDRPAVNHALSAATDCVLIDNVRAAESATVHLLQHGHRDIGIIIGPADIFTSAQRLQGYNKALAEHHATQSERLIAYSDYTVEGGYAAMRMLLQAQNEMTAVFVTNYEMTLGAMIAASEMDVKIPEQLSFIGFDHMDLARVTHPKLTIVTQPLEEIGAQVARLLLERLQERTRKAPVTIALSTTLQQGASVQEPFGQAH